MLDDVLAMRDDEFAAAVATNQEISHYVFGEMKRQLEAAAANANAGPNKEEAEKLLLIAVRMVSMEEKGLKIRQLVDREVITLPRIVVLCSLYAQSNDHVLQWWMQKICDRAPILLEQIPQLHDVFYHAFVSIHHQISALASPCIMEATEIQNQLVDITKTINALVSGSDAFLAFLTGPNAHEQGFGHSFDGHTLLRSILVCYELDLPTLSQLSRNDKAIPKARRNILSVIFRWIECHFLEVIKKDESMADSSCEDFFGVLNSLLHNPDAKEPASLLSDLCQLFQLKSKCKKAFEESSVDSARLEYLLLLLSELPERSRPAPRPVVDSTSPNVVVGNSPGDEKSAVVNSIATEVKEIFPDLGDGFLELCIRACEYSSDRVIMALLEDSLPEAVAHIDRSLKKTDPQFTALTEPKPQPTTQPKKMDSTQIWVGKKKQDDKYKPESIKKNPELVAKQQLLAQTYEEVPFWQGEVTHVDEYNDDYNDEMEDYEPFGVHDDEPTDYEEIIARNKAVRAQEEEDAFWESMRNPNHMNRLPTQDDEEEDEENAATPAEAANGTAQQDPKAKKDAKAAPSRSGQKNKSQKPPATKEPEDPKKTAINRARKEQHKSSVANHRRKDKALKKQSGGMF